MKTSKEELVEHLRAARLGDPATSHERAEELLLRVINDPEVTAPWEAAKEGWWYT